MDLQTILAEVESWPIEDRLRLVERIWEGLGDRGDEPGLTEAQRAEIDRRLADDDASPDDVVTWEEVKSEALRRAGR
ncbi:addiction module protein [Tautonia plasticadhaerens]|uniref:Addiction module component n=1 Tax=Tautonia plasticadhaerens TaxID=2527974 RepID=A0A518HD02_9BACT|nr:addiction module protein [Tautonia plasticadhaerens]QDV38739.1 Putative addiction module component [Tautonia plasticadhaerens]